jgi:hypothetical protein
VLREVGLPDGDAGVGRRADDEAQLGLDATPIRALWHVRGVRVVATDVDWAGGAGPEARGPGEAVLMVTGGRRGVARELTGPGADRLVRRLA